MMNVPHDYASAVLALNGRARKRLGGGRLTPTWIVRLDADRIAIVLAQTNVAIFASDDTVAVCAGGWYTVTTKDRINAALRATGASVYQRKGAWYVNTADGEREFSDVERKPLATCRRAA